MSTETTFWYRRREVLKGKDGVELLIECEDSINLYDVLRGWWKDMDTFTLQMKDAHEEMRPPTDIPPKVVEEMRRLGKVQSKEKQWVLSYIDLHGIDIFRYRTATELVIAKELDKLTRVMNPTILNPPKPPEVKVTVEPVNNETTPAPAGMSIVRDTVENVEVTQTSTEPLPSTIPSEETMTSD